MSDPNRPRHIKWDPVAVLLKDTAFSAKRKLLAVGESVYRVNGASLSEPVIELPDAPGRGGRVAFHPDGDLLAEADDQGTAVLWDIGDLQHPHAAGELPPLDDSVDDVAFTPDGRTLLTGGGDGTLRLWDLGPLPAAAHDPERLACQVAAWRPGPHAVATARAGTGLPRPVPLTHPGHRDPCCPHRSTAIRSARRRRTRGRPAAQAVLLDADHHVRGPDGPRQWSPGGRRRHGRR